MSLQDSPLPSSYSSEWKIRCPDDFHLHLRDGDLLNYTTAFTAKGFKRALIMPNLTPVIETAEQALAYRTRILASLSKNSDSELHDFEPLMTLYLKESTSVNELKTLKRHPELLGCKYYPRGVTTNAQEGIQSLEAIAPILAEMEALQIPLMIHGESSETEVDVFDREAYFIENVLSRLIKQFPGLTVTLEHISTKLATEFILDAPANVKATLTLHHLMLTRNDLLADGVKPHFYCKPIVKRTHDREALLAAALGKLDAPHLETSSHSEKNPPNSLATGKFFFGSDSAPHNQTNKENDCGCAGVFSAPFCIEMLATLFDEHNRQKFLEPFVSLNGCSHYGLKPNTSYIRLKPLSSPSMPISDKPDAKSLQIPLFYDFNNCGTFIPFQAGRNLNWKSERISETDTA